MRLKKAALPVAEMWGQSACYRGIRKRRRRCGRPENSGAENFKQPISILMSYQLKNAAGSIEAVIDDNCGLKKFHSIANVLCEDLAIKFTGKSGDLDAMDWHFKYKGHPLMLHYHVYNGVSICPTNSLDNEVVNELALLLEHKCF